MIQKIILCSILISSFLYSQSIYESVYNNDIYNFMERLSDKGFIGLFNDICPLPRLNIAAKLLSVNEQRDKLLETDKERLNFYLKEYSFEVRYLNRDSSVVSEFFNCETGGVSSKEYGVGSLKYAGSGERFNFYKFYSPLFTLTADPILGISYDFSKKYYHQFSGVQIYGRVSDNWGYYFNYRDNLESGDNLDRTKFFSNETGVITSKSSAKKIEYSETRGGISYGWKWGMITAAKDFIHIGSSSQSSVILSEKAPSYPFFRLEISPVDWFRYNFVHGWLNSGLIDSSSIRYTGVTSTYENRSIAYSSIPKYYAGHSLSFQPFHNWWLTLGESMTYSDKIEYVYFLPVFLRLADHYLTMNGGDSGGNAQIYFNTSYIWQAIQSKLYFTLYVDEMSPESLLSGGNNAQVYAVTLGGNFTNPLWEGNYFTMEYNAVRPYSYMNGDPAQTYASSGYTLGHWIGSNAVQIYAEMEQYFPYMINVKAFYNYVMKGEKENIDNYYDRVTSTYPLLAGPNSYYSEFGFGVSYQPINDLYFNLDLTSVNISTGRFKTEYNIDRGTGFGVGVRYGR